ncbi:MAG: FeoC-like transcriptional regulator [Rhodospirillales bacterium]
MILAEVRDYIAQRGRAPLTDLCVRFGMDDEALRPMLEHWVRKGRAPHRTGGEGKCGSCCCSCSEPEIYEWVPRG